VSIATGYRYLHEAIDVIAAQAPELPDVLAAGLRQGWAFVCLDGTLIPSTRVSAPSETGHDLWYSGKHKQHGGNVQVLTDPTGWPVWVSDVEPGSVHAERANALLKEHLASAAPDHPRPRENRRHHSRRTRTTQPSETSPVRRPHYFSAVWKLDHAEVLTSFL